MSDEGSEAESSDSKYLLLNVPDFNDSSFPNHKSACSECQGKGFVESDGKQVECSKCKLTKMRSFLRLGMFEWSDEPDTAKRLLSYLPEAGQPGNPSRGDNHFDEDDKKRFPFQRDGSDLSRTDEDAEAAGNREIVFTDDVRVRPTEDPSHGLSVAQRQAETYRLYSRGGWRDHSDGNRISTTYGDKVEIVRGNYKMIVMSRQNDPGMAHGWDVDGCHLNDYAPGTMPGASVYQEFIADYEDNDTGYGGIYLLVNSTENVWESARNAGNFREENWGDLWDTYVGSENPPEGSVVEKKDFQGLIEHILKEKDHDVNDNTWKDWEVDPAKQVISNKDTAYDITDKHLKKHPYPGFGGHPQDFDKDEEKSGGTLEDRGKSELEKKVERYRARPRVRDSKHLGMVRSNPHIIEKVWAKRIDSQTGSHKCPVPHIQESTFANAHIENNTYIGCHIAHEAVVGFKHDALEVGGLKLETTQAAIEISETIAPLSIELFAGFKFEKAPDTHLKWGKRWFKFETEAMEAEARDLAVWKYIKDENRLLDKVTELGFAKTEALNSYATTTSMNTAISDTKTAINTQLTQINTNFTNCISKENTILAGITNIG